MSNFRVRVGLNRGLGPVDFKNLSVLTEEINSFLRKLGEDAGLADQENHWLATRIADGSFLSDAEPESAITPEHAVQLQSMLDCVVRGDARGAQARGVREQTRLQFAVLARKAESTGVPVEFGLYDGLPTTGITWQSVTTDNAERLIESIAPQVEFIGALHGLIHAWFKEASQPHFQLRELEHNTLVNCYYPGGLYQDLVRAFMRKDELVHVQGLVRANRMDKSIDSIRVTKIKGSAEFSDADFDRFFGCAPDMTGDVDSVAYIERNRRHDA